MSIVQLLSPPEAQRLTQRIKLTASSVRDGLFKLRNLVEEAKNSNAWQVLGFRSWTEYLADTLGDEPMRLAREERQELVAYLSGEGMSTRAIAPVVGVAHETVAQDIKAAAVRNLTAAADAYEEFSGAIDKTLADDELFERVAVAAAPQTMMRVDAETGEVKDVPARHVTGRDGKEYAVPLERPDRRPPTEERAFQEADLINSVRELLKPITLHSGDLSDAARGHLIALFNETIQTLGRSK